LTFIQSSVEEEVKIWFVNGQEELGGYDVVDPKENHRKVF